MKLLKYLGIVFIFIIFCLNVYSTDIYEAHGKSLLAPLTTTDKFGMVINVNQTIAPINIYKTSSSTATKCYLVNVTSTSTSEGITMANGTFFGNICTLNNQINITPNHFYILYVDNNGANYDAYYSNAETPYNSGYINWSTGTQIGTSLLGNPRYRSVTAINFSNLKGATPIIQTNISNRGYYNRTTITGNAITTTAVNMSYTLDNGVRHYFANNSISSTFTLTGLSEGNHNLSLRSLDSFGTNYNNLTFYVDTTNPTITNNIPSQIYNYNFNGSWFSCSDTNLTSCNISIDGFNKASGTDFTLTHNGNLNYNITALDLAGNTVVDSGIVYVNPYQYFSFEDGVRLIYLTNYTFGGYSSAGRYVAIPTGDLSLGNNTKQFVSFGYTKENFSFIINNTAKLNSTFQVNPITLTLKVYSEASPTTQLYFNLTMNNVSDYTQYLNQHNFSLYYNETLKGQLTLSISSAGYCSRNIYTSMDSYTAASNVVYLPLSSDCTPVIFKTVNLAETQPIEDVVFTFKRIISGQPTFVGQAKTDSQGYTYFNFYSGADYTITISKSGYITQIINSIPGKIDYTIVMSTTASLNNYLYDGFSYYLHPIDSIISSLPFTASAFSFDENNLLSKETFTVTGVNVSYSDSSTSASGGLMSFNITNSSPYYILNLSVIRNGQTYNFIKTLNYYSVNASNNFTLQKVGDQLNTSENTTDRIFIMLILYAMALGMGAMFSIAISPFIGLIPITIFIIIGYIPLGVGAVIYLISIMGVLYFGR